MGLLMRRTEAIDLLIEHGPIGVDEEVANKMLTALEKVGMLPPRTKLGTLGIEDNAWEPEHDEK